ncbi:hypothetical protein MMC11_001674 [Xylographa trunciseda]|nr:hypothetical protein [Xylographa trunciseda]
MAYSPTPGPPQSRRLSPTPPLLTKRDKRRNAIEQRMKDLDFSFMSRREPYSRAQLNMLSRDIAFINRADPYDTKPLEDYADDMGSEVAVYGGDSTIGGLRGGGTSFSDAENRPPLGKYAARFVQDVNDTMERRDTELTEIVVRQLPLERLNLILALCMNSSKNRFNQKVQTLMEECEFAIAVATEEHKALKDSVRERTIASVQTKKRNLEKEKGLLDNADSSALLLHPTQFTITQPASPGGAHNNRKTRHTRHRLDTDNTETNGEIPKRKRKAPADFDNVSPGPVGRGFADPDNSFYWDRGYSALEQQHTTTALSINQLFGTKELQLVTRAAIENVGQHWAKRSKPPQSSTKPVLLTNSATNGDVSDPEAAHTGPHTAEHNSEDDAEQDTTATLMAPMMERGGSYATRSTRKDETAHLYEAFEGSRQEALRCFGIAAVGAHLKMLRTKDEIPLTSPLNGQEILDDVALIEAAKASNAY